MQTRILRAPASAEGLRLDAWLAEELEVTRSAAQRLLEEDCVLINGAPVKKNYRLRGGEEITVTLPDLRQPDAQPQDIPLDIIYEDDCLLVVNKPRGMVVHPAPGNPDSTLVNALLSHCGSGLSGIGGAARPGIVHRIDKDTSGLLVVAKTDAAHRHLAAQLKDHSLWRIYEAVARGTIRDDAGTIEGPIGRSPKNRKKMAVVPGGKPALTEYQVIARYNGYTHLRCRLHTGRTHQIRVHLANTGHPLAGDPLYGGRGDKSGLLGQCLHARQIEFVHPRLGSQIRLSTPLPPYFQDFLDKIGKL